MVMMMKRSFLNILIIGAVVLVARFIFPYSVFASTFTDDTQAEFDAGTHSNTVWDTNHVELSSGQTGGTFTSQIFNGGGAGTSWSQLS